MTRALIIHTVTWPLWLAAERDIARGLRDMATVDALDLVRLLGRDNFGPTWRDRLYRKIDKPFERWLLPVINGRDITPDLSTDFRELPLPCEVDMLRSCSLGGARVGLAALSSAVSATKISSNGRVSDYGKTIKATWRTALKSQRLAEQVAVLGYDQVYLFNGRHAQTRPFCDLLEPRAKVLRYERGGKPESYIMVDTPLHDPRTRARMIIDHVLDKEAGLDFFEERIHRTPGTDAYRFTHHQIRQAVPADLCEGEYVAFFTSSPDEYFATRPERPFGLFKDQYEVAQHLAEACRAAGRKLVVRLHPHLRFKHESWRCEWNFERLQAAGALVLHPDDQFDSYALVARAAGVVTCGSTIGYEAAFRNIPVGVVGQHQSALIGAAVPLTSLAELAQFVAAPVAPIRAKESALLFGSWCKSSGKVLEELDQNDGPEFARIAGKMVSPTRAAVAAMKKRMGLRPAVA